MKNHTLINLVLGFCIACLLSSCNRVYQSSYHEIGTDSIYSIQFIARNPIHKFELEIFNPSGQAAEFYVTPGKFDLFSDATILAGLLNKEMNDQAKCIALWKFICDWTYHGQALSSIDQKINDPAVLVNAFQVGICDDRNAALANLARLAGINARVYSLNGHVVSELYYDSSWHMFDADKHLYYKTPDGAVASVGYLSIHPEIIQAKDKELHSFFEKFRNRRTESAISSTVDNKITSFYDITRSDYTSAISLNAGDRLWLRTEPVNSWHSWYSISVMKRNGPDNVRLGTLISKIEGKSDSTGPGAEIVFSQQLPFPIQQIALTTKGNYQVFYSVDKKRWLFKGISNSNSSSLSFQAFNELGAPYVFKYYIKLLPLEEVVVSAGSQCIIDSKFTFSDKILDDNLVRDFRVVPLNSAAKRMEVKFRQVPY